MALIATITPSKVLGATDPVSYSDLNTGFAPTCALSGTLDQATQATFAVTRYGSVDVSAGATPVTIFAGVTGKTMRAFRIDIMRTSSITAGSAVRLVIRTTSASPTILAYATIADIAAAVKLAEASITYTVTAIGASLAAGSGIEVVVTDVANAPINGTSGTLVCAVSALYE